jgi:hypothetical protein
MQLARPGIALDPRRFGRAADAHACEIADKATPGDDLRLFLTTFGAGFLFVSILLA